MNENRVTPADAASVGSGVAGGSIGFTAASAIGGAGGGCRMTATTDRPASPASSAMVKAARRRLVMAGC